MISKEVLKEFFLETGTPNWKRYIQSYKSANPLRFWERTDEESSVNNERYLLSFVNYEYAKRGFLSRGKGFEIVYEDSEGYFSLNFGFVGGMLCYLPDEKSARNFIQLLKPEVRGYFPLSNLFIKSIS